MYMTQLQYLDNLKDVERAQNEENEKKFEEFLQKEIERKKKLEEEISKLEERTTQLNDTRNELFRQLNDMDKQNEAKREERNQYKSKVNIKQT